jgi:hypothetical protein
MVNEWKGQAIERLTAMSLAKATAQETAEATEAEVDPHLSLAKEAGQVDIFELVRFAST